MTRAGNCEHEQCLELGNGESLCLGCGATFIYCHACSEAGCAERAICHMPPACAPRCPSLAPNGVNQDGTPKPQNVAEQCQRSLIGKEPHEGMCGLWKEDGSSLMWFRASPYAGELPGLSDAQRDEHIRKLGDFYARPPLKVKP